MKRKKEIWKIPVLCALIVLLVIAYGRAKIYQGYKYIECFKNEGGEITTNLLQSNQSVRQKIHLNKKASGIALFFATHGNAIIDGQLQVDILDSDGNAKTSIKADAKEIKDNEYFNLKFDKGLQLPEGEYEIVLKFENIDEQTIALWLGSTQGTEHAMQIDGENQENYHLVMKQMVNQNDDFYKMYGILAVVFILTCIIAYLLIYVYNIKMHIVYICTGILLGIVYMLMIPLFEAPDEPTHFYKAYAVSNKILGIEFDENNVVMRADDDAYVYQTSGMTREYYNQCYEQLKQVSVKNSEIVTTKRWHLKAYSYFYFTSALGLSVGRLLHISSAWTFLLGRLFNCIFFTGVVAYSIKKIPFGKSILFV